MHEAPLDGILIFLTCIEISNLRCKLIAGTDSFPYLTAVTICILDIVMSPEGVA